MSTLTQIIDDYSQRVWNKQDLSAIDQYISPRIQIKSAIGQTFGPSGMKQVVEKWFQSFPDVKCDFFKYVEEIDSVTSYWRAYGTHQGTFLNIAPTGKFICFEGTTWYKLKNGIIVDYAATVDMQPIIQYLNQE